MRRKGQDDTVKKIYRVQKDEPRKGEAGKTGAEIGKGRTERKGERVKVSRDGARDRQKKTALRLLSSA